MVLCIQWTDNKSYIFTAIINTCLFSLRAVLHAAWQRAEVPVPEAPAVLTAEPGFGRLRAQGGRRPPAQPASPLGRGDNLAASALALVSERWTCDNRTVNSKAWSKPRSVRQAPEPGSNATVQPSQAEKLDWPVLKALLDLLRGNDANNDTSPTRRKWLGFR